MPSYKDDRLGKTIYANDIKLLKVHEHRSARTSAMMANLGLIKVDYTNLLHAIDDIESDDIVTPFEKLELKRHWESLNTFRTTTLQKVVRFGIELGAEYLAYESAYTSLETLMNIILAVMDEDTDISAEADLSTLFEAYYDAATILDEKIFTLETGLIDGIDHRSRYEVRISATKRRIPVDGTTSTITARLFLDDDDKSADFTDSNFTWQRTTENGASDAIWNSAQSHSKSITIDINDLVNGMATFSCTFEYYYGTTIKVLKRGQITLVHDVAEPSVTANGKAITVSAGIIEIGGVKYTVPPKTVTITNTGQGYIGFDTSDPEIYYVKMVPQTSSVSWLDFNDLVTAPTISHVIGKFTANTSSISGAEIFRAQPLSSFIESHFMDVLATEVYEDMATWASAMGINSVFEKLAVFDLFANAIKANRIEIGDIDTLKFEVLPDGYQVGSTTYPVFRLMKGPTMLISIDGYNKKLEMNPDSGFWKGDLDIMNTDGTVVVRTVKKESATTSTSANPSGSIYKLDSLKSESSVSISSTPATASGSYGGKTISKACFRTTSGKLQYGGKSGSVTSSNVTYPNYHTWQSGALGTNLGAQKVKVTVIGGSHGGTAVCYFKKNGVTQSWTGNGSASFTFDYSPTDYYEIGAKTYRSTYTQYQYNWAYWQAYDDAGGTSWNQIDYGYTESTSEKDTSGLPAWAPEGTIVRVYTYVGSYEDYRDYTSYASITMTFESTNSYGAGFVFINTDGSYSTLGFTTGFLRHSTYPITLNGWASSSHLSYVSGSDVISQFSAFSIGQTYTTNPASSSVSNYTPADGINSALSSIAFVTNNGSSITFTSATSSRTINAFGSDGGTIGVYSALAVSVTKMVKTAGIITETIKRTPDNANATIGESDAPFKAAYAETFIGKLTGHVNGSASAVDPGNTNKVWGAVAN
ncbi:MAG: hypothetical protein GX585_05835 [Clostridiales bacterium]|nr:hypothetical protein [Clostridiales bacterium]